SPYLRDPSSPEGLEVVRQVRQAGTTTGFFSLVGHGVSAELQKRVFEAAEAFFTLPLDEKMKLVSPPLQNRGYELIGSQALQEGTLPDLKEVGNPIGYLPLPLYLGQSSRPTLPGARVCF